MRLHFLLLESDSDAEYLAAVESGNTAKASRMVKAAAKLAGYTLGVFHKTFSQFDAFDITRGDLGSHFASTSQQAQALRERQTGTPHILELFIKLENPIRLNDEGTFHADAVAPQLHKKGIIDKATRDRLFKIGDRGDPAQRKAANVEVRAIITKAGYDGVIYSNKFEGKGNSYIAFDPSQIKSADPVTYDADGNIIPLSQRFNPQSPDIRY